VIDTLQRKVVPMGEWTPDLAALGATGGTLAQNVIPWTQGYKSFRSLVVRSSALTARFQGGTFGRDTGANVYNYAGDATKLYQQGPGSVNYTDSSRLVGGAYGTVTEDWWEYAQWGQTIIATNYTDVPQVITLAGANFAALGGTPPRARHVGIVKDFVVFGNVNYGAGPTPNRLYWSAINNSADYTIAAATQCDIQDLQGDGGAIQKVIGGEYGLIFQERAIWRMTYVGSPVVFQFDLVERNRGAFAPQSVIGWGNVVFFLASDGFYAYLGGLTVPIGAGKVDTTFLSDLQTSFAYRVNAAIDPLNKLVMWAYPGAGSTNGTCNRIMIYNWAVKRWSRIEGLSLDALVRFAATGYSLEGLDAISGSIDALSPSLDSPAWAGGVQLMAAFDSSHKLNTISGSAMTAMVDTGETQLSPGMRSSVLYSRPLVDGTAASVTLGSRNRIADTISYGSAVNQDATGVCAHRSNARYHTARTVTASDFNFIQGVELTYTQDGER